MPANYGERLASLEQRMAHVEKISEMIPAIQFENQKQTNVLDRLESMSNIGMKERGEMQAKLSEIAIGVDRVKWAWKVGGIFITTTTAVVAWFAGVLKPFLAWVATK